MWKRQMRPKGTRQGNVHRIFFKMNQGADTVSGVYFRTGAQHLRDLAKTECDVKILATGGKLQNAQETKHRGSTGSKRYGRQ